MRFPVQLNPATEYVATPTSQNLKRPSRPRLSRRRRFLRRDAARLNSRHLLMPSFYPAYYTSHARVSLK